MDSIGKSSGPGPTERTAHPWRGVRSDYEDNTRHSDTIMFVSYDPQSRFLDDLSIPRDTQVSFPGVPAIRRINEVFAYEFKRSGKILISPPWPPSAPWNRAPAGTAAGAVSMVLMVAKEAISKFLPDRLNS